MIRTVFEQVILIDTSAVIALHDPSERHHAEAKRLYSATTESFWAVLDSTSHECFTTARYRGSLQAALEHYSFMRRSGFQLLRFEAGDESDAEELLRRYRDHRLSFHDALCAAVMKRVGVYKIFTFDSDFRMLGFEVLPGST